MIRGSAASLAGQQRCCRRYLASSTARDSQRRSLRRRNRQTTEKEFGGIRRSTNAKSLQKKSSKPPPPPPPPPTHSPSFFANPLAWYSAKLESHPFATKCITSGIISASGDLLCQYLVHRNRLAAQEDLNQESTGGPAEEKQAEPRTFAPDWYRTGRFGVLGFFLVAPVVHLWYARLMRYFPGTNVGAVLKRTATDQLLLRRCSCLHL